MWFVHGEFERNDMVEYLVKLEVIYLLKWLSAFMELVVCVSDIL